MVTQTQYNAAVAANDVPMWEIGPYGSGGTWLFDNTAINTITRTANWDWMTKRGALLRPRRHDGPRLLGLLHGSQLVLNYLEARLLRILSVAMGRSDDRDDLHAAGEILLRKQQDADVPAIRCLVPRKLPTLGSCSTTSRRSPGTVQAS